MRKIKLGLLVLLIATPIFFLAVDQSHALFGRWSTKIGNPPAPGEEKPPDPKPPGGDDGLGPGEFKVPWRCNQTYKSDSYSGHSAYSIDVNRGGSGVDKGDPVFASADGQVVDIQIGNGQVTIKHEGNYFTISAHMQPVRVREGQKVELGQKIGEINDKGTTAGQHHLHVNHAKNCSLSSLDRTLLRPEKYGNAPGCRIQVKYKGYNPDPRSTFPSVGGGFFYYSKGC